jgi:hypothetical protein
MKILLTFVSILLASFSYGQVTVTSMSLPDIGDELDYTIFAEYQDTVSYRISGENMEWTFDGFNTVNTQTEVYTDISTTALADSFPNANMLLEFGGFESAALKTDTSLALVGVIVEGLGGLGVEFNVDLDEPFRLRTAPFEYGDVIEDEFSVIVSFSASIIPGIDSFDIGVPGTTIDSIRITTDISKKEEAIGWGTLNMLGLQKEVLQIKEDNNTNTIIELGVTAFGTMLWINAAALLGDMVDAFGGNQTTTTYKFLTANDKRSVIEFDESRVIDTSDISTLVVNGRTSAEFLSSTADLSLNQSAFTLYPNPATDLLHITTEVGEDIESISIYNAAGQLEKKINHLIKWQSVSTENLPIGIYFLHIKTKNLETVKRFQVVR